MSYPQPTTIMWTAAVYLAFLGVLGSCQPFYNEDCPHNLIKRPVPTADGGVTINCCQPLGATDCPPGTEVKPCNKTFDPEWCKPCDKGLVQMHYSRIVDERPCIRPDIKCTPEEDLVLVDGSLECQCRAAQGYCGQPRHCLKVDKTCPEGFQLHHRDCNCIQTVTETSTAVPGRGTSMLPKSSTPSPPPFSDPASIMTPASQENANNSGDEWMATEQPPFPYGENKEVLDPSGSSNGSTNLPPGVIAGIVVPVFVILGAFVGGCLFWRKRGGNNTTCIFAIRNSITYIFNQVPPDEKKQESSESLVGTLDPPADVPEEKEVTTIAVEEERDPQPEEGSMGAAADETLLKCSGSFCQELNTRISLLV